MIRKHMITVNRVAS